MSENYQQLKSPDALLLLGTQCPHCAAVLSALADLVKQGLIASLEVVNLEQKPEVATRLGVRTVPWMRIGWFELEGLHSKQELQQWAEKAGRGEGADVYFSDLLSAGRVNKVLEILRNQQGLIVHLFDLMDNADAQMNVRLGISVIMEEFAAEDWFAGFIPRLGELCKHEDERVRGDACHYLSLTGNAAAVPYIQALLDDNSDDVREVAQESIEVLNTGG